MNAIAAVLLGVASGVIVVLLLQSWPHGYRWSSDIAWTEGEPSGQQIYEVKLGQSRRKFLKPLRTALAKLSRVLNKERRRPMDVEFRARLSVTGIGPHPDVEKVVDIPVDKARRPVIARAIRVQLLPEQCDAHELQYFPEDIRRARRDGTLTIAALLGVCDAVLRVYVFAYRPRAGTRWMLRGTYRLASIKPGEFAGLEIQRSADGRPPKRSDPPIATAEIEARATRPRATLALGGWTIDVRRNTDPPL